VLRLMSRTVTDRGRMKAEGRADAEPIAPNDTPANRALNRRVEIILKVAEQ
jgi:type VI secretion system protein ImpK